MSSAIPTVTSTSTHPATVSPARVRFAPSPTGMLHVGSIRSGLFNWLWARHTGGTSILRIEDTDRSRLVPEAYDQICDSLEALGIKPDEGPREGGAYGPYLQSERLDLYRQYADQLLATGALYRCWCSPERLADLRTQAQAAGVAFKYDRHCLTPYNHKRPADPHVLRFRIPDTNPASPNAPHVVAWTDAVRGQLSFRLAELDDFVALKADNYPTYHFANVVDDHLMAISHVLRADEWLPSTPKHLLLFQAFGWDAPIYAHLPAVQGPDGKKKLSKRDGAQSVQEYIDQGYLPETLRSFLASLGWNDGTTQEVYTTPELIAKFTLDRVQKSPAKFDRDRLTWMNGHLIRQMPLPELLERSAAFWPAEAADTPSDYRLAVLGLVQDRLKYLAELPELVDFFFADPTPPAAVANPDWTTAVITVLESSDFSHDDLETRLRALAAEQDIKPGDLFKHIRLAVTGRTTAPGLFETLHVLGRDTTLRRLKATQ